jgi:hypothetical protein
LSANSDFCRRLESQDSNPKALGLRICWKFYDLKKFT